MPSSMVSQFFGRYRASSDMVIVACRRGTWRVRLPLVTRSMVRLRTMASFSGRACESHELRARWVAAASWAARLAARARSLAACSAAFC